MSDCKKSLEKPFTINNNNSGVEWTIFPNSIPKPFEHPKDCVDGTIAACIDVELEECINICQNSTTCQFGYHVNDNKRNYCLPLYTSDYYPDSNPVYYLHHKNCFDKTKSKNVKVNSFVNKKTWGNNYLPNEANAVFYNDIVSIVNKQDNKRFVLVATKNSKDKKEIPIFQQTNGYGTYLFLKSALDVKLIDKVDFGDSLSFQIMEKISETEFKPTSNILVTSISDTDSPVSDDNSLFFRNYNEPVSVNVEKFTIEPLSLKTHQTVTYSDSFLLKSYSGYLENKKEGEGNYKLVLNTSPIIDNKIKESMIFSFYNDDKKLYYCHKGKCLSVKLGDTKKFGQKASFENNITFTRKDCFGSCNWNNTKLESSLEENKSGLSSICIILVVILVILLLSTVYVFLI